MRGAQVLNWCTIHLARVHIAEISPCRIGISGFMLIAPPIAEVFTPHRSTNTIWHFQS
uniref:Uncharacterized protein n=1 Tax=Physcomitrium patens TaxID=3218 RepID=A0A2K1IZ05_PHYPA|nr:hypothetical protein PHYPA_024331 [Physcomitrium patens]